jgi:peroxiredoxin
MTRRSLLAFLPTVSLLRAASPQDSSASAAAAPDFSLPDANGSTIRLSDQQGKVVVLDFWATWCGGCKVEIPWFLEFANRYKDRGLVVIGVALDEEGWKTVRPFLAERKITYPVVLGNEQLSARYDASALPKTLLIDRKGRIAVSHVGLVDKAAFEKQIQALLR